MLYITFIHQVLLLLCLLQKQNNNNEKWIKKTFFSVLALRFMSFSHSLIRFFPIFSTIFFVCFFFQNAQFHFLPWLLALFFFSLRKNNNEKNEKIKKPHNSHFVYGQRGHAMVFIQIILPCYGCVNSIYISIQCYVNL